MSSTFQFVPEEHAYLLDGKRMPHVTGVLEDYGLVNYDDIPDATLAHKAEIGSAAHLAAHYWDEGDLDWSTVSDEVLPYIIAWTKFRAESHFTHRLIEHRGIATVEGMKYGYTLDREGTLNGRDVLLEIKCTANVEKSWGPQLAAYDIPLYERDGKVRQRIAVHLKPNGTYNLHEYREVRDYVVFKLALRQAWQRLQGEADGNHPADLAE